MDDITRLATELGQAVSRHPHYVALREAEEAAETDPAARTLVEAFGRQQERLLQLAHDRKPIEPDDKRKMNDLQRQVMSNERLKRLQAAQVNFKHLMDTVNNAIHAALEPQADAPPPQKV
jgi:cell fate (sporulation/competence/biofilm development) regulator YlbF (YheA/YmcA/DUF963 family)